MVLPLENDGVSQLTGVLAVAAWLSLLSGAALLLRRRWPEQREWSRKLVHIGAGPVVLIAWAFGVERLIAVPAAGAIIWVIRVLTGRITTWLAKVRVWGTVVHLCVRMVGLPFHGLRQY